MFPKWHVLFGFIFSLLLFLIFPEINALEASILFFSSFLIDVDHYLYYVFRKRKLGILSAYNWFVIHGKRFRQLSKEEKLKHYCSILIFHGIEPLILLFFLSQIFPLFYFILLGFVFHLLLDYAYEIKVGRVTNKFSLFLHIIKVRRLLHVEDLKN